jgi:hypothetical protein
MGQTSTPENLVACHNNNDADQKPKRDGCLRMEITPIFPIAVQKFSKYLRCIYKFLKYFQIITYLFRYFFWNS